MHPLTCLTVLAIMNASVRGRVVGDVLAVRIQKVNKIAVSIWPILFAAVVAQSLRMFAAYKVERGIRLIVSISAMARRNKINDLEDTRTTNWKPLTRDFHQATFFPAND